MASLFFSRKISFLLLLSLLLVSLAIHPVIVSADEHHDNDEHKADLSDLQDDADEDDLDDEAITNSLMNEEASADATVPTPSVGGADGEGESIATPIKPKPLEVKLVPYTTPSSAGLLMAETFDGDVMSRWIKSSHEKFSGTWQVTKREVEALQGDLGLRIMDKAKHHGIAMKLPANAALTNNMGKDIVVSYEAKFENDLTCGGAYMKLFDSAGLKGGAASDFNNETPYVVMFGPDRCGSMTNKVHLIIKQKNPVTGDWVEHHLRDPPATPYGTLTHVYGFHLKSDNTYAIYLDGKMEKSGSLLEHFEPPFTPAKEIKDPEDKKPEDWVDAAKITDPTATKPEDWDEDQPMMIPDESAAMPEGWLSNEPLTIPDETKSKPETWNEEEDGEWVAPTKSNPLCKDAAGCGPWVAPQVVNPKYKGKWTAPLIDNPAYKGPWEPRNIANPDYFESKNPHALPDITAVGFELWTMDSGILFDNIALSRDVNAVKSFVEATWTIRNKIEAQREATVAEETKLPKLPGSGMLGKAGMIVSMLSHTNPALAITLAASGLIGFLMLAIKLFRGKAATTAPSSAATAAAEIPEKTAQKSAKKDEDETKEGTSSADEDSGAGVESETDDVKTATPSKSGADGVRKRAAKGHKASE